MEQLALDVCCGSRMMWFDKQDERAVFVDKRNESHILCDDRVLNITPDIQADFTALPFPDESFYIVAFDPPHLVNAGDKSWLAKKYGKLQNNWQVDLAKGFEECFRVLKPNGTLVFKWNENQVPVKSILLLAKREPLFGHTTMRHRKGKNGYATHWFTFLKDK